MVLTLTSWTTWTTSGGQSGNLDWTDMIGQPRLLYVAALRQALVHRLASLAISATYAATYPQFITDSIAIGTDLDWWQRLQAIHNAVWDLAPDTTATSAALPFLDPTLYLAGLAARTDTDLGLNRARALALLGDSEPITDYGSAIWANQLRRLLNLMYLVPTWPHTDGKIHRGAYGQTIDVGTCPATEIASTLPTFAERLAELQTATWTGITPVAGQEGLASGRDNTYETYRRAATWNYPATSHSRTIEVHGLLSATGWPEYTTQGLLTPMASAATSATSQTLDIGKSRTLTENADWYLNGIVGIENYDTPGGFPLLET